MKRQKRKTAQSRKQAAAAAQPAASKMSRRDVLAWGKFVALGAVVVGGGGYLMLNNVRAGISEADLSKLGNGMPTVVQVHDPSCPTCQALQRQTRLALEHFEEGQIQYLVAHLDHPDGRRLANRYGVGRVTLLLFDGSGRMRQVISGQQTREALVDAFQQHLRRTRAASG